MDDKKEYEITYAEGEMCKCGDNLFLIISWGAVEIGWGELSFCYNAEDETWECDSEFMSDEFCKAVLAKWFDGIGGNNDNTKTN